MLRHEQACIRVEADEKTVTVSTGILKTEAFDTSVADKNKEPGAYPSAYIAAALY